SSGNCYVTGNFNGTASFGATNLTCSGDYDIFVAILNTSGAWQWAVQAGGAGTDQGNSIAVDSSGNCYVTGYFSGTASFGATNLTSSGGDDIFVAKYGV
ncbi:MAG: SBBP repeat-containing protein, partial [Petrimonas sp.]|nr:SBBP repeat-containing protein [Petrimonas sp.]